MKTSRPTPGVMLGTWSAPLLFAVITLLGLLSALLGEALAWKATAWIALSAPVLATIWFCFSRQREGR
jgi:hypothetical protein